MEFTSENCVTVKGHRAERLPDGLVLPLWPWNTSPGSVIYICQDRFIFFLNSTEHWASSDQLPPGWGGSLRPEAGLLFKSPDVDASSGSPHNWPHHIYIFICVVSFTHCSFVVVTLCELILSWACASLTDTEPALLHLAESGKPLVLLPIRPNWYPDNVASLNLSINNIYTSSYSIELQPRLCSGRGREYLIYL